MRYCYMLFLLLLTGATMASQHVLYGTVVKVIDGDTFDLVISANNVYRIRMRDIDTPERGQEYYKICKQALAAQIASKEVKVIWSGTDRNQRILGTVYYQGRHINLYMVEAGYAWHFKRFSNDLRFARAEQRARLAKRGLWEHGHPMAPWDFRSGRK